MLYLLISISVIVAVIFSVVLILLHIHFVEDYTEDRASCLLQLLLYRTDEFITYRLGRNDEYGCIADF